MHKWKPSSLASTTKTFLHTTHYTEIMGWNGSQFSSPCRSVVMCAPGLDWAKCFCANRHLCCRIPGEPSHKRNILSGFVSIKTLFYCLENTLVCCFHRSSEAKTNLLSPTGASSSASETSVRMMTARTEENVYGPQQSGRNFSKQTSLHITY